MSEKLVNCIAEMQEEEALALAQELLDTGTPATEILDDCRKAMGIVGQRFEEGQFFIPELILAGEMLKSISALVKPYLQGDSEVKKDAKVIVGTVQGDIHDIGKDIVVFMLDVNGFDVYDLGIDVPPQAFVDEITKVQPEVVALSGFLTLSYDSMKATVEAIEAAGQRNSVKIMIGGGVVDDQVREYAGADAYGLDAMAAIALAKQWTASS
jgi:methanogenic corrinoid protein MtbC1